MAVEETRAKACCTDAATGSPPSRCNLPLRWPGWQFPTSERSPPGVEAGRASGSSLLR